jgi:hypothetical protein
MAEDIEALKRLHRALINLNKRAERSSNEILVSNFVDSDHYLSYYQPRITK